MQQAAVKVESREQSAAPLCPCLRRAESCCSHLTAVTRLQCTRVQHPLPCTSDDPDTISPALVSQTQNIQIDSLIHNKGFGTQMIDTDPAKTTPTIYHTEYGIYWCSWKKKYSNFVKLSNSFRQI